MYTLQIELLKFWIDNWDKIKDDASKYTCIKISDLSVEAKEYLEMHSNLRSGLCTNANLDDLEYEIIQDMFRSWRHYSGSTSYPVEGDWKGTWIRLV